MRIFFDTTGAHRPAFNLSDRNYFKHTLAEARPVIAEGGGVS